MKKVGFGSLADSNHVKPKEKKPLGKYCFLSVSRNRCVGGPSVGRVPAGGCAVLRGWGGGGC